MTKIRNANEWAYGITENIFLILKWSYGLRIRQAKEHANYYQTATIIVEGRNINFIERCKCGQPCASLRHIRYFDMGICGFPFTKNIIC